jgi:hypothetical protein
MKHIKQIADYSMVGGMGAVVMAGLSGCGDSGLPPAQPPQENTFQTASQKQGAFVVIQEVAPKQYKIVDEYPSSETRVILKTLDGKEKILSQEELDALIKEEAKKIEEGTSRLTSNEQISSGMGGMGLGETILASAAGAVLGSWIGSKLFNNQNYQQKRQASYKNPQTYSRSKNSFNKAKKASTKRSGFFGNKQSSTAKRTTAPRRSTATKRSSGFFGSSRSSSRSFGG